MGSNSEVGRRDLVKRAIALGVISVPTVSALSACASGGDDDGGGGGAKGEKTAKNPLGVDKNAGLEILIFDGGFGTKYVDDDVQTYQKSFGKVEKGSTEKIQSKVQGRMAAGDPPDLINNSGGEAMDVPALLGQGQLAELGPLLDAPSIDDPNKKVRDTLRPGTIEMGQYGDDKCYRMNIAYSVFGIWYSQKLLDDHGWEYPKTWDAMLDLCAEAKKEGIAGWTYTGVYPQYLGFSMLPMIGKVGGVEVLDAIDNFEPNAWKQDAVKSVLEAHYELYAKGYILKGSGGWEHTEAQTEWTKGRAIFIPNGSWVENEQKDTTPEDFQMAVSPSPNLDGSDLLPFETIWAQAGEPYVVPAKGKNVNGGMEFLRHMLAKKSAAGFTKLVSSLASVEGSEEGLDLPSGLTAAVGLLEAAGTGNVVNPRFPDWYPTTWREDIVFVLGDMMKGDASPGEAVNKIQKIADDAAKDDSIKKYKH